MRHRTIFDPRLRMLALMVCVTVVVSACVTTVETVDVAPAVAAASPGGAEDVAAAPRKPLGAANHRGERRPLRVPDSIDATGSRDVFEELKSLIEGAPDGSTIVFKRGGTYRIGEVLRLRGTRGITLDGNGATLKLSGTGFAGGGIFIESQSRDTTVRDLTLVGNHAAGGTKDACCGNEAQRGISVWGSTNTLIERVEVRRVGGDCFGVDAHDERIWSDGVVIRDSTCKLNGRHGVHINAGSNVRIVDGVWDDIGYAAFASEPSPGNLGAKGVVIRDNAVGRYGLTDNYRGWLFYGCDSQAHGGAVISDVTITGNSVAGNAGGKDGKTLGLNVLSCDNGIRQNWTITNNSAGKAVAGPVMRLEGIQGVTVTGNRQPLSSGKLATFPDSSGVTYRK